MTSPDSTKTKAPLAERLVFSKRPVVMILMLLATLVLAWQATQLKVAASFEKMIPTQHEYVVNFLENRADLTSLGNVVRVTVQAKEGDIFSADYLETLKQVTDKAFYIPGVNRPEMASLWTANVRWTSVTEEGLEGGQVIPATYNGDAESIAQVRQNVELSGQIGRLVGNDFKSTIVYLPLLEINPETGKRLDYKEFSERIETELRDEFNSGKIEIRVTGFAKIVGDLIDGATQVVLFFGVAVLITLVMLFLYSRSVKSTVATLACSVTAVIWQLGLLNAMGMGLDPYSMLVPFLVFAIGVSHGVQIVNAIAHKQGEGHNKLDSARLAFRGLYIAGLTALLSDGFGFATLMVIDIPVIRDLAIAASVGVAVIILTNLVLLPLIMSYTGVDDKAVKALQAAESGNNKVWHFLAGFAQAKMAKGALAVGLALLAVGLWGNANVQIGDLDKGAPELRADSRYNLDNAYVTNNYSTSTDVFVVMVETELDGCIKYNTLAAVDLFQWTIEQVPGVQSSVSLADRSKFVISAYSEGDLKWMSLNRNQFVLNGTISGMNLSDGLFSSDCSFMPIIVFLEDHKADTLKRVVAAAEDFIAKNDTGDAVFKLAAGNAGIEAATNEVVERAQVEMLIWVYAVVALLVWLAFRSVRTVICIIAPLALTSLLCSALMVVLGIGVKVATLPVIALGVGIGVDYGIYIYGKLEEYLKQGMPFADAYFETLKSTGKAVVFTGLTLGIGVATWAFSPIKFQADMGLLLTFMFLWNMVGAVVFLPALAYFLDRRGEKV
ncbi:MAG: MMPL family transporter [Gammaproteobacteria bacterium]|uniref:efflux RND transporter permease subunit n=1 Tax=Limnobacter sp. TaxID=2003368 RepID=UPI001DF093F4|nr:MMPL family transporter [Limnobacter sp.]MBU0783701.1 MMPL family transporter [Gammaproteobacteria bacterium]MBU0848685.1 MMPL family transporter [Gammaproteobacteria bacterium]MBU1266597.1 MMPL family transporter [Gammaproteobacteria bacterium]MBU1781067.1 MMPL family transporter [Gammaproteobacteria bacterium]MBU2087489.1 MMPL family transporter [Gammaproteobacteria bacterium]